jgi:hypothetical protein
VARRRRHPLDDAPFPDRRGVEVTPPGQPTGSRLCIPFEQSQRVLAHEDAQVVFGLGQKAVRVDEFEPIAGLQRIPLMDIAVYEDGPLVIVGLDATGGAGTRVIDGTFRTRPVEMLPRCRDEREKPFALLGSRGEAAIGSRAPHALGRRTENLVPSRDRQSELVQRASEPLEEKSTSVCVFSQHPRAALTVREA